MAEWDSGQDGRVGVLFVCLGNICRSPLAEGVFRARARKLGVLDRLDIDSCGTGGWHVGASPDPRSVAVAALRSIPLDHRARQLDPPRDFVRFQHIIAMDRSNVREIEAAGETHGLARRPIRLLRALKGAREGAEHADVPDPYYGGQDGFERVFAMVDVACAELLEELADEIRR